MLVMVAFVLVSGVDDAGNAIAASVVTGTIRAGPAAVLGALVWSLVTLWWAHPRSSGHCLVSAFGSLLWLFFSSAIVVPLAMVGIRLARRALRRASRLVEKPVRHGELVASGGLAFAHGSNDAQKTMGLMTAALVAGGHLSRFAVPFWVALASALLLTFGTLLGGWRVVRTLGRRIYRIRSLDGLVSQGSSGLIVLAASLAGAPVSTTDVVAPAVVGVGSGERWRHVRWAVVGEIGLAWLVTLPVSGGLGALFLVVWRWVG